MLASTFLSIIFIPVLYVVIRTLVPGKGRHGRTKTMTKRRRRCREAHMRRRLLCIVVAVVADALGGAGRAAEAGAATDGADGADRHRAGARSKKPWRVRSRRTLTVAQAAQAILDAEALLQQARVVYKPTVGATIDVTMLDNERGFDEFVTQPRTQGSSAAMVSYPSFRRRAGRRQRRRATRWRSRGSTPATSVVRWPRHGQAYLAVIAEQRQVVVNQVAIDNAQAHVDYARARLEAGAGSKLNELRASQEQSKPIAGCSKRRGWRCGAPRKRSVCCSRPTSRSTRRR